MRLNRKLKYRHLSQIEKEYICQYIWHLLPIARDNSHPMCKISRSQISLSLWRWTADGVSLNEGHVKQDAIKYDVRFLPHTRNARKIAETNNKGLRHEHTVPRILLTDHMIKEDMSRSDIFKFLSQFCKAVIVTLDEDKSLRPKSSMPEGWSWDCGDPYARYRESKEELYNEIIHQFS